MRKSVHYREANGLPAKDGVSALTSAVATPAHAAAHVVSQASFARDIVPMFAAFASAMMWRLDLTSYEAVMANAQTIAGRISDPNNPMPPPPFPMLTAAQIKLFNRWMSEGCQP